MYIYIYIYMYDYSARKQRMALWESAAEGLWISSQLKVMFKGPEALGWFGGKLQYHAILRWKKEKKPTEVIFQVTTKTAKQFLLSIKHEDLSTAKRADVRPA